MTNPTPNTPSREATKELLEAGLLFHTAPAEVILEKHFAPLRVELDRVDESNDVLTRQLTEARAELARLRNVPAVSNQWTHRKPILPGLYLLLPSEAGETPMLVSVRLDRASGIPVLVDEPEGTDSPDDLESLHEDHWWYGPIMEPAAIPAPTDDANGTAEKFDDPKVLWEMITDKQSALTQAREEVARLTKIHVTCWNALRRAASVFKWLDCYSHKECDDDFAKVKKAILLTPSESGGYTVILETELESLRSTVATLQRDKERIERALAEIADQSGCKWSQRSANAALSTPKPEGTT